MHLLNYMYKRKGKQDHQISMSGRTRLFDAVVFDNVTPHKTAVERSVYLCIIKGHKPGMSYLLEFVTYKHMTYSKPTKNMKY